MVRFIEELSMSAWPALQTHLYDGWVLRMANGYTKRANSINPIYNSEIVMDTKIDYCKLFYSKRELNVIYKITPLSVDIDNALEQKGYSRIDDTSVRTMDLKDCNIKEVNLPTSEYQVVVDRVVTDEWIEGYIRTSGIDDDLTKETLAKMIRKIVGETIFVTVKNKGKSIAFGYGVVNQSYVGFYDIFVNKDFRGKGLGRLVMNQIILTSKEIGATKAYIQVVVGNTPAEKLYESLGFVEQYIYWYRKL